MSGMAPGGPVLNGQESCADNQGSRQPLGRVTSGAAQAWGSVQQQAEPSEMEEVQVETRMGIGWPHPLLPSHDGYQG